MLDAIISLLYPEPLKYYVETVELWEPQVWEYKILPGHIAFKIVDSAGLPFEILIEELCEREIILDVVGFMVAALRSKNFSVKRLYHMMHSEVFTREMFDDCLHYIRIKQLL